MFGIGAGELVIIAVLALVLLGPDQLTTGLRKAGAILRQVREVSRGVQAELTEGLRDLEREVSPGPPAARANSERAGASAPTAAGEAGAAARSGMALPPSAPVTAPAEPPS
ncbi:MAG: twin-arginine translocase TatA/TatE family subunit [Anaeromyxobacter sp.]